MKKMLLSLCCAVILINTVHATTHEEFIKVL